MVEKRRSDAPDILNQYKTLMIALYGVAEHAFPIRSYDIRRIVPDLSEPEIVHRCAELGDGGYLAMENIKRSMDASVPPSVVVNRLTIYGRQYVAVVSNADRLSP